MRISQVVEAREFVWLDGAEEVPEAKFRPRSVPDYDDAQAVNEAGKLKQLFLPSLNRKREDAAKSTR